jgi:hypothetical protein
VSGGWKDIQYATASDGALGTGVAQDETVTPHRKRFAFEKNFHECSLLWAIAAYDGAVKQSHTPKDVGGTQMNMYWLKVRQSFGCILSGWNAQLTLKPGQRNRQFGVNQPHAPRDIGFFKITGQSKRATISCLTGLSRTILNVQAAHTRF